MELNNQNPTEPAVQTPVQQSPESSTVQNQESPAANPGEKSYTQEQLNAMMANEKRTARQALLKELGFDIKDDKSYKDTIKAIKSTLDAEKTQSQLDSEARERAESEKAEAEAKASKLEMKVEALSAGANPEYLEDIIVLAQSKVDENTPIGKAMAELKTRYPVLFSTESSGTGNSTNPPRKPNSTSEGLGQRLAKSHKASTKSSYFKD